MKPESPCKGCENRHERCHTECEEYGQYKEELAEFRRKRYGKRWDEFTDYVCVQKSKGRGIRRR